MLNINLSKRARANCFNFNISINDKVVQICTSFPLHLYKRWPIFNKGLQQKWQGCCLRGLLSAIFTQYINMKEKCIQHKPVDIRREDKKILCTFHERLKLWDYSQREMAESEIRQCDGLFWLGALFGDIELISMIKEKRNRNTLYNNIQLIIVSTSRWLPSGDLPEYNIVAGVSRTEG